MSSSFKLALVIVLLVLFVPQHPIAGTQNNSATPNCVITVPSDWGEFKAASSAGLVFEDSAGTLRIIGNTPCQVSSTASLPLLNLEVRRK